MVGRAHLREDAGERQSPELPSRKAIDHDGTFGCLRRKLRKRVTRAHAADPRAVARRPGGAARVARIRGLRGAVRPLLRSVDVRSVSIVLFGLVVAACSSSTSEDPASDPATSPPPAEAAADPAPPADPETPGGPADPPAACAIDLGTKAVEIGKAAAAGEQVLTIDARSWSKTSWGDTDNEAVVLEVSRGAARVGHFVLHQGADTFTYAMHVGALEAGEALSIRVSALTAKNADKRACITKATLAPTSSFGALAEGIEHAPIVKWPVKKVFDDLPVLVGWSKKGKSYQITYTNENGGTTALCGGGARGLRSEIARWGRGLDMESGYAYGGAGRWDRCDGPAVPTAAAPRMEAAHPTFYYGDGHNRLYESRAGYGQACGTGSDKTADGDLDGWNVKNPGSEADKDDPFTVVLRNVPVDMDALDVARYGGRREGIVDTYAPWLYRLTDAETAREGKIDNAMTFPMSRYLFVDVYAADVGGSGDGTCGPVPAAPQITHVTGGFVLRAVSKSGVVSDGPQMTVDYFGGGGTGVKRVAIPLAAGVSAKDITKLVFDAYDDDGIYLLGIGDAFVPRASGSNGAVLDYVHKGMKPLAAYVDDGRSGCVDGQSTRDGVAYPCVGSAIDIVP